MKKTVLSMSCLLALAILAAPASGQATALAGQSQGTVRVAPPPPPPPPPPPLVPTGAPAPPPPPDPPPPPPEGTMPMTPATPVVAAPAAPAVPPAPPEPPPPPTPPEVTEARTAQRPAAAPAAPKAPKAPEPAPTPRPAAAPQPTPAREERDAFGPNIRVEVTITYQAGNATPVRRSALLTAASGSYNARLRAGVSVPVPSTTLSPTPAKAGDGKDVSPEVAGRPVTSFQYRSVGLNLDLGRAQVVRDQIQLVNLSVEFSALDEKTADGQVMPVFPTFSQQFNLMLEDGKPLLVAQSSDLVDNVERKQSVEVKATVLR